MIITLDFETYSEIDLRKVGAWAYAAHPSTEVLCMAWAADGEEPRIWRPGEPMPEFLNLVGSPVLELHAHNAEFEQAIWSHVCVPRYGWPRTALRQWHCTAARVAACSLPRGLGAAAAALSLAHKKDDEGRRIMLRLCKPLKATKKLPQRRDDNPLLHARLAAYCQQDVRTEAAVHRATPDLSRDERIAWLVDQKINQTGIPIDREFAAAAVKIDTEYKAVLTEELRTLTGDPEITGGAIEKIKTFCNARGARLRDLTLASVVSAIQDKCLHPEARQALDLRQRLSRTSVAKYQAMLDRAGPDGRVRGAHVYHAAGTGRWGGAGVQTQNLVRGKLKGPAIDAAVAAILAADWQILEAECGDVSNTLAYCVRSAIRAEPGKRLLVGDFAAIECCVLAWLAGQSDLVDMLQDRQDVYSRLAEKIYGAQDGDYSATTHPNERQLGKVAILGLGYGMGAEKFRTTCKSYGIEIDDAMAAHTKKVYRETNYRIVEFWSRLERAAFAAISEGGVHSAGRIAYQVQDDFLVCQLPSSRKIRYFRPRIITVATSFGDRKSIAYSSPAINGRDLEETLTYGGKLAENVTQAVARDLLRDALVTLVARGWPVIMHVHDEIVVETDRHSLDEFLVRMMATREWAHGCPVHAEGFETERYRK